MTFTEFKGMRKRATAAEMERAGVAHNKETQSEWLYPGDQLIESTARLKYEFMGMFCLLVEFREYLSDGLEPAANTNGKGSIHKMATQASFFISMFILASLLIDIDFVARPSRVCGVCGLGQFR